MRKEDSICDPWGRRRMELWGLLSCGFYLFKFGMGKIAWQGEGCSNTELDLSLGLLSFWTSGIKVLTLAGPMCPAGLFSPNSPSFSLFQPHWPLSVPLLIILLPATGPLHALPLCPKCSCLFFFT